VVEYLLNKGRGHSISKYVKIFFLLILIFTSSGSFAKSAEVDITSSYLPFYKGSWWTYSTSEGTKETVKISDYHRIGDVLTLTSKSDMSGENHYVFLKDKVYRFKSLSKTDKGLQYTKGLLLLNAPFFTGTIWSSELDEIGASYIEVLSKEDIETPAGKFKDAAKIGIRSFNDPNYSAIFWIVKNVGIVKTLETQFSKTLEKYSIAKEKTAIVNTMDSKDFASLLSIIRTEPTMPKNINEEKLHPKNDLKSFLKPENIFTIAGVIVIFLIILILVKISSFFGTEVNQLTIESKKNLAGSYISTGDFEKAKVILEGLLKKKPNFPDLLNFHGIALLGLGDHDKAQENFQAALGINPNFVQAKLNLAKTFISAKRSQDAETVLIELLNDHPEYSDVHNLLAEVYIEGKKRSDAIRHLNKALEINPAYSKARENLNKIETDKGDDNA